VNRIKKEPELKEPIKIEWTGEARRQFRIDFASHHEKVRKTLDREKTNIVVKTLEEADILDRKLESFGKLWTGRDFEYQGNNKQMGRSALRRQQKLREKLKERFDISEEVEL